MANTDREVGAKTKRYSNIESIGAGQRRSSTPNLTDHTHLQSAATAALRYAQRELERAASPRRDSSENGRRQRDSFDQNRKTPQPAGYYIPPPGYADPLRDNLDDEGNLKLEQPYSEERDRRWSGPYDDRRGWPVDPRYHRGNNWYKRGHKNPSHPRYAPDRPVKKFMPSLSHQDWSVPQAKQILSHWATLATLLGGVQATLLAYYSKQEQLGSGEEDPIYRMVIAISCSALFLEVYGALLAAGTIVASISLQAKNAQSNDPFAQPNNCQTDRETLLNNGMFSLNAINANPVSSPGPPLSPRASAILDRLTVLVGFLIPLGAVFELIGLAGYTAHYLGNSVAITMGLTLAVAVAILVTIIAGLLGMQAGNRAIQTQQNSTL
ncbi:uncharacterized protein FA14DRAFT_177898 [Meira miltonrushii]|uniref:Transmembrane protein n=1 Tax=Meira miltonrushii TaxID=1280837 RepID=A0A316VDZ5_9BASI|nr:uncharacterized protein FA14DRAFT_177898 [Meira miltonrushii]PWN34493.1 hypothetical protein FA14DRAFT_177898 [Meira miltonrushii]